MRDRGFGGVPDAGEVDVDHVLPHLLVELLERAEAEDAGVGRRDVQPAELGNAVVHRGLHCIEVAQFGLVATMRRSSASTVLTVCSRSAGVDIA
jgi:hypothetical protein